MPLVGIGQDLFVDTFVVIQTRYIGDAGQNAKRKRSHSRGNKKLLMIGEKFFEQWDADQKKARIPEGFFTLAVNSYGFRSAAGRGAWG
ncbi:MAG: hypothetical protein AAF485_29800 [Chloroflexota bacterium]